MELTAAYAAFVNNGTAVWPHAIRSIEGLEGEPLYQREGGGPGEVVRPWHIWELDRMLQEVMISGTGRGAQLDRPAAGKTGTSQEYRDAWFVGFTADLVVGVWVGNDDGTPMNGVTGGGLPARIWRDVMLVAHRDLPPRPLPGIESVPVVAVGQPSGFQAFLDSLFGG